MRSHTVTAVLDAPREDVFAYLSEIENLPEWATEFARELRFEDGRAKVVNGLGEFYFSIDADVETGVIDMYAGPSEDELMLFPTRVVPPAGRPERVQLHDVPGARHARRPVRVPARVPCSASSRTSGVRSSDDAAQPRRSRLPPRQGRPALERCACARVCRGGVRRRSAVVRVGLAAALRGGRPADRRTRPALGAE